MNEIINLIQEIEKKLQDNINFLRNDIFLVIIKFLNEYHFILINNLKNSDKPFLQRRIIFILYQIDGQIEKQYHLKSSGEFLIQPFLQLLISIYNLFEEREQRTIDRFINDLQNYYVDILNNKDKRLNDLRSSLAREIEERKKIVKTYKTQFENVNKQFEDTQKLLSIASADVLIKSYEETANEEKKHSVYLFWWGISIIFCGILAVYILFANCFKELTISLSWEHFLFKFSIFIMFLIPAIYIIKEASKREDHYFKLQDLSLKIRTIPNYLKDIPDIPAEKLSEKDKVRLELAKVIFGQHLTTPTSKTDDNTIDELINLLRLTIKNK